MKGDFSRQTFDPDKAYTRVLRQQGRVDLDADWNEQQAILNHLNRTTRTDIIGPAGAPIDAAGFAIELSGGAVNIGAGHFYVQGQFLNLEQAVTFDAQPYFGNVPLFLDTDGTPMDSPTAGRYLFFLESWDYHITAVEDASLREPALGASGPDTTTRVKTVWRIRALRLDDAGSSAHCETVTPAWTNLITPPDGTLAAQARAVPPVTNLCVLPETAGYQSLDHRHYRVEIHDPGNPDTATWKWSRDNAAFVVHWLERNGNELTVSSTGFDAHIGFHNGGWVEITSDTYELSGQPGTLVRVDQVIGDVLQVDTTTATGSLDLIDFGDNPKIRAWDSAGALDVSTGTFLALENGVEVEFGAGSYATGDYWMIPARSGIGVLWPKAGGVALAQPRFGTEHRFARLALMDFEADTWTWIVDCRPLFPATTALMTMDVLGGDAQEILPDPADPTALLPLHQPLQVGVARGIHPVANALVRFQVSSGNGQLSDEIVATNPNGRAQVDFSLDSITLIQTVEAQLVSPGGDPRHLLHSFSARLSRAAEVSFDPVNCPPLAGDRTVQAAIEWLCQTRTQGCATYVLSPDSDWQAVLLGLQEGEDAKICFRRGNYRTETRLEMRDLGHIQLSGCGPGSRIIASGPECALYFENCASLKVSDLAFLSPLVSDPQSPIADINGVLTAQACGTVAVDDCHFLTGASDRDDRACLTIRQVRGGRAETITSHVSVNNNEFLVGNGQTGVLITDAGVVNVGHNQISGNGEVPAASDDNGNVIINPEIVTGIFKRLVGDMLEGTNTSTGGTRVEVGAGAFSARINSPVDKKDWKRAMTANPPTEEELADNQAFTSYVERVATYIATNPDRAPSYNLIRNAILISSGETTVKPETARRIIVSGDAIEVVAASPDNTGREITLSVREHRVSFNSELNQSDWNRLIRAVPTNNVNSSDVLNQVVRETAKRLITDAGFRAQFNAADAYINELAARTVAIAAKGIICAGTRLDDVRVCGNNLTRVYEGIRVAVSHRAPATAPPDMVDTVAICDNHMTLALPVSTTRGDQGIKVGNAQRVTVSGNEVLYSPLNDDPLYSTGIELWGHYGPQIHLRENTVSSAVHAIRFTVEDYQFNSDKNFPLWRAVGNLSINGGRFAFVFRTDPEAPGGEQQVPFIERDNVSVL